MPCCGCIGAFQSGGKAMRVIQVLSGLHIGGVQSVVIADSTQGVVELLQQLQKEGKL